MNKNNYSAILDFGHSKLRLGVFNKNLENDYSTSKKIIEKDNIEEYSNTVKFIIKDAEKNIADHLENIIVLYDSSQIHSIDLSIKKDFDQNVYFKDINSSLILEANQLKELFYKIQGKLELAGELNDKKSGGKKWLKD